MKTTMRTMISTLTGSLLVAATWLSPALAMPNLQNLLSSGGGAGMAPQPVIYPSDYKVGRSLNKTTGLSDVTVYWTDISPEDTSTLIERSNSAGVWTTLDAIAQPLDGSQTYVDQGLPPDTEYCYRVHIRGAAGAEVLTRPLCVVTQMVGDPGVWRTQLRVRLANVPNAGTNGWVSASLNAGPGNVPSGSWTGINTPIDDLEAGSDVTYDLIQNGIVTLRDITLIQLYTNSTDSFCVSQLQLLVNGVVAFDKFYGDAATTCQWVAGGNAMRIHHDELRASPLFASFMNPTPSPTVPTDELVSRLESIIGTMMFERTDVAWRDPSDGPGVEVSHQAADTVRADMHLVSTGFASPDIHLQLDMQVTFQSSGGGTVWELVFNPVKFDANVNFPWWSDILVALIHPICAPIASMAANHLADCMSLLEQYVAEQIEKAFKAPSQRVKVSLPDYCLVPAVNVDGEGALRFSCAQYKSPFRVREAVTTRSLLLR